MSIYHEQFIEQYFDICTDDCPHVYIVLEAVVNNSVYSLL